MQGTGLYFEDARGLDKVKSFQWEGLGGDEEKRGKREEGSRARRSRAHPRERHLQHRSGLTSAKTRASASVQGRDPRAGLRGEEAGRFPRGQR